MAIRLIDPNKQSHAYMSGLRAFADVKFDMLLIRDFKIFQRDERVYSISPSVVFKQDGKNQFHPLVSMPDELRAEVDAEIVSAYFKVKEKKP